MSVFITIKQALNPSTGRRTNGGYDEAKIAKSHQSPLQKVKASNNVSHSKLESLDTSDIWRPDTRTFLELHSELKPRQADTSNTYVSTCGYLNGDASQPRTANIGFDCRVDTKNAIWGFCPTTVSAVSDCGLVGGCVDAYACDTGCGISGDPSVTTFTWSVNFLTPTLTILFFTPTSALVYLIANTQVGLLC